MSVCVKGKIDGTFRPAHPVHFEHSACSEFSPTPACYGKIKRNELKWQEQQKPSDLVLLVHSGFLYGSHFIKYKIQCRVLLSSLLHDLVLGEGGREGKSERCNTCKYSNQVHYFFLSYKSYEGQHFWPQFCTHIFTKVKIHSVEPG